KEIALAKPPPQFTPERTPTTLMSAWSIGFFTFWSTSSALSPIFSAVTCPIRTLASFWKLYACPTSQDFVISAIFYLLSQLSWLVFSVGARRPGAASDARPRARIGLEARLEPQLDVHALELDVRQDRDRRAVPAGGALASRHVDLRRLEGV